MNIKPDPFSSASLNLLHLFRLNRQLIEVEMIGNIALDIASEKTENIREFLELATRREVYSFRRGVSGVVVPSIWAITADTIRVKIPECQDPMSRDNK